MHNYDSVPNMVKLSSFNYINDVLAVYGARISTANKCLQPKTRGYIGHFFNESNKPVYDFDIVSVKSGKSFANIYSDIYRKIPSEVLADIRECFVETSKAIYV